MINHILEENILIITFRGKINQKDITNFLEKFSLLKNLPENLLLLYDLLNADLTFGTEEINAISQFANLSTQNYKSVRTAFLVDNPKLTAYSTLFSNLAEPNKTNRQIFSTKEAALKWLRIKG